MVTLPLIEGRNFNQDLYNRALSSIFRVWSRIYDPNYALSRDPNIWEKVLRDATVKQTIDQRLHSVAGRDWTFEPASDEDPDKRAAKIMEDLFGQIRHFGEARKELAQAIFRSRSYAYIEGRRRMISAAGEESRAWWCPARLRDIDPRRFRLRPETVRQSEGRDRIDVVFEMWSVVRMQYEPVRNPELFVKMIYQDEEARLGYGRGLLDAVYFYWWVKQIILREGLQGLERWAQGILVGKIGSLREGSVGRSNDDQRDQMLDVLRDMRSRHVVVHGEDDEINVVETSGQGHQIVISFLKYIDDKLIALILGAVLPFGGGDSGGSFARAKVEEGTSETLIQFDRDKLDEVITADLCSLTWRMNRGNLAAVGLAEARMPSYKTVQEKHEDPKEAAQIIAQVGPLGLPLRADEVYRKLGFTQPGPEDELFEPKPPQPAIGGGPPPIV